jgi:hypothetical protein
MGIRVPYLPGLELARAVSLQRTAVEQLWHNTSIADLIAQHPGTCDDDDFAGLSRQLTLDVATHQGELRSFQHTYRIEAAGVADLCGDLIMEIVAGLAAKHGRAVDAPGTDTWLKLRRTWCGLLTEALRKGPVRQQLRTMHATAALCRFQVEWEAAVRVQ